MSADHDIRDDRVRLLTVCTGNICRSPYSAAVLRAGLEWARPGAFEVTSAGTHALVGNRMDAGSSRLLEAKGVADEDFRARSLTHRMLREQAVVLVMASTHREVVIDEAPVVHRRTFTLRAFAAALTAVGSAGDWSARLAEVGADDDVASRWKALPTLIAGHVAAVPRAERDVADPFQRGEAAFGRMAGEIDPAVRTIVAWEHQFSR
jgi:protein-tyrosine phosphatase